MRSHDMKPCRIHLTGASGSGVTTLGRALADAMAIPHHDTDDYFHQPTVPPFQHKRDIAERLRLMHEMFLPRIDWVLSGSVEGWGDVLIPYFDLVVFLTTPREIRLQRLRAREATHFGADAVASGGWRHDQTEQFIEGPRTTKPAIAKVAAWQGTRPGSPNCPARCCGSTERDRCPSWSRKFATVPAEYEIRLARQGGNVHADRKQQAASYAPQKSPGRN